MAVVVSLFDGAGCGLEALKRAGISVSEYYASEIDKKAMEIAKKNHPEIIHIGDVKDVEPLFNIPDHVDLLIGGSPCQGFSQAGKRGAFDDPRSKLFWEYVRVLKELRESNPNLKFMLENVRMKQEYQDIISEALGVKPIAINSNLVSAQNRYRLYWTNIEGVEQPEDREIYLKDIIEDGVLYEEGHEPHALTERRTEEAKAIRKAHMKAHGTDFSPRRAKELAPRTDGKMNCLTANYSDKEHLVSGLIRVGTADDIKGHDYNKRIYSIEGKGPSLTSSSGGNLEPKIAIVLEATKQGYVEIPPNCGVDLNFPKSKTRRGRKMEKKSNCLTSSAHNLYWYNGITYRKLTPLECERLQTLPDGYTEGVSKTQRYKMIGNGWTIEVIVHIFRGLTLCQS